jgi:RNA polymerase sigma-70 factor, ECF subfamily
LTATVARMDGEEERLSLIRAAGAGDLAAFESLMRQHERLVLVTALRLLGNLEDAQDASQEVFLKLYRNLRRLERSENISGWLYIVTVSVCRDVRSRRPESVAIEETVEPAEPGAGPPQQLDEAERRRALKLSLRMLAEREREAVILRDLEGLTTQEVARVMGSSEATVRSHISQARVKMRGFLERYFRRRP